MTKRRATAGAVRVTGGDARARRASQASAAGLVTGKGLSVDPSGRQRTAPDGPHFYRGPNGELYLRLGQWLHSPTGSPQRIDVNITADFAAAVLELMRITGDDVLVPDPDNPGTPESPGTPRTVTEGLADFETDLGDVTSDLADLEARTIGAGTGLTGGGDLTASRTLAADFGTGAGKVTEGNDSRLTDSRTPSAHKTSHENGGADEISVAGLSGLLADAQTPLAHNHGAADINSGTIAPARLGSGTPSAATVLYGDSVFRVPFDIDDWVESDVATISGGTVTVPSDYITTDPTESAPSAIWITTGNSRAIVLENIVDNTSFDLTSIEDGDVRWTVIKKL